MPTKQISESESGEKLKELVQTSTRVAESVAEAVQVAQEKAEQIIERMNDVPKTP